MREREICWKRLGKNNLDPPTSTPRIDRRPPFRNSKKKKKKRTRSRRGRGRGRGRQEEGDQARPLRPQGHQLLRLVHRGPARLRDGVLLRRQRLLHPAPVVLLRLGVDPGVVRLAHQGVGREERVLPALHHGGQAEHGEGPRRRGAFSFFFFTFPGGGGGVGGGSRRGRPLKTHFSLSFFLLSLSLENLKFTRKKPVLRRGRVGDQVWEVGAGPPDRDPPDLGDCDVSREVFFFFSHFQNNFFLRIFSTHFFSPFFLFPFLPSISLSLALSHLSLFSLSQVPLLCQLGPLVARPAPPAQPVDQRRPVGVQAPHPLHPHARVPLAGGAHGLRDAE